MSGLIMKKYLYNLILSSLLLGSMQSQAGSGAGGAITFINETEEEMHVIWQGAGCGGIVADMLFVCERHFVPKHESRNYQYNWGVTATWMNVGLHNQYTHPCVDGKLKNDDCKFAHFKVDTKAWKTDLCTMKKLKSGEYSLTCKR